MGRCLCLSKNPNNISSQSTSQNAVGKLFLPIFSTRAFPMLFECLRPTMLPVKPLHDHRDNLHCISHRHTSEFLSRREYAHVVVQGQKNTATKHFKKLALKSAYIPCPPPPSRHCPIRSHCDRCCLRFMPVLMDRAARSPFHQKKGGRRGPRARANAPALRCTASLRAQRWRIGRYSDSNRYGCAYSDVRWVSTRYYFQYYYYYYYLRQPRRVWKCLCVWEGCVSFLPPW